MKVLGIDTSLRSTGYAVVEEEGSRLVALEYGNIRNKADLPLTRCLAEIHGRVAELVERHRPDAVAVESVIYGKNAGTMLVLGEARGAVLVAAAEAGVPAYEYEPRRMKRAVCGNSLAEKDQDRKSTRLNSSHP